MPPNPRMQRTPSAPLMRQPLGDCPEEGVARRVGRPVRTEPYVVISDSGTEELRGLRGRGKSTVGHRTGNPLTPN
jgi:hypothetical protein